MVSNQTVQPTDKSNNLVLMCLSSKSDTHYPQPAALQNSKTENSDMTWGERAEGRKLAKLSQCHRGANIHIMYR